MAREIAVVFINGNAAAVSGYGSRQMLTELRGRPPVWSALSRGWMVQPRLARDLIAVAESRGYEVVVSEGEPADPGGARW